MRSCGKKIQNSKSVTSSVYLLHTYLETQLWKHCEKMFERSFSIISVGDEEL